MLQERQVEAASQSAMLCEVIDLSKVFAWDYPYMNSSRTILPLAVV